MESKKDITLSIETAIGGGSLAFYKNETEIDSWAGTKAVSKAEDVLEQISELLKKNDIKNTDIQLIAVSDGPGSPTGTKIGLAIAKGLANALGIETVEISAGEFFDLNVESSRLGAKISKNLASLIGEKVTRNMRPITNDC